MLLRSSSCTSPKVIIIININDYHSQLTLQVPILRTPHRVVYLLVCFFVCCCLRIRSKATTQDPPASRPSISISHRDATAEKTEVGISFAGEFLPTPGTWFKWGVFRHRLSSLAICFVPVRTPYPYFAETAAVVDVSYNRLSAGSGSTRPSQKFAFAPGLGSSSSISLSFFYYTVLARWVRPAVIVHLADLQLWLRPSCPSPYQLMRPLLPL